MRSLLFLFASFVSYKSALSRLHSLPEDTHAFPKFSVTFLNGLPVLNETAEHWLKHGLRGGEQEFLDQPWNPAPHQTPVHPKEIGSGDTSSDTPAPIHDPAAQASNFTLEHMRMGPKDSYLCLIPKPSEPPSSPQQEEPETDSTPARSWSLLQPLSGTCLYHRQGWFTYSYCHNREIRQFKELAQPQSRLPGTYRPEEDPDWESYTLGRAPRSSEEPGADLTVAERNAQAANLELARNAGSRYLVQRWGDGSICDKTGKPREVEVQFHCSMVMTDHILFVKETKTCSSRRDTAEEGIIRCREVVSSASQAQSAWPRLPAGDTPMKFPRRKAVLPSPASGMASGSSSDSTGQQDKPKAGHGMSADSDDDSETGEKTKEQLYSELVEKTLELLMGEEGVDAITGSKRQGVNARVEDGEVIVEYIEEGDDDGSDVSNWVVEALKAAGYETTGEVLNKKKKGDNDNDKESSSSSKKGKNSKDSKSRKGGPRWFGGRFEL
ncbi:hypothetical protein CC1G_11931 [Coprinopsis cinerea okayama7|uniref:Protein OS-9 homolog n=1 Tax=Coprinopsis cinerea (strain Okayama-7 / 130 / ATCC MYA-4618 / FGSC 9003) TaxID=240176 RepID=A8NFS1_COPC7|nr:hypothetical protein CC1G_11931 [Coprinopsis cinerea okayama7\|eukprot:XP_001833354.2 hypothetical protein CC1G_11931 [Coprinopsis cinerea okayama7\